MAAIDALFGNHVHDKSGKKIDLKTHCAGKVVGIYFSAHWCPPCRGFTPVLSKFYTGHHKHKNFEIIFVSSDRDEKSFDEYFHEMPWLKLDFKERNKKQELCTKYGVRGIPTFILLDGDSGDIINEDGRTAIEDGDPADFPWKE